MQSDTTDDELQFRFQMLKGERVGDGEYLLHGLMDGSDFRDADEWDTVKASYLFVEGVGFAAPAFEFSQHEQEVVVTQSTPAGSANITFE